MSWDPVKERAYLLLAETRSALKNGVRHYNRAGEVLETALAVLETLQREGEVRTDASEQKPVTEVALEMKILFEEKGPPR